MAAISLAVGPGTGVLGRMGVGPLSLAPAERLYAPWLALAEESQVFPMPLGGLGPCMSTYFAMEEQWLRYAGDGMIDLVLHSQNCLHGARFIVRHRRKVRRALLVNGPFSGAYLAERFWKLPCAVDMRPGSRFLQELEFELARGFAKFRRGQRRNPGYHVPECHFFGLKHDRVVQHGSPNPDLGALVTHHCIGGGSCPPITDQFHWHETEGDPNHINVVRHGPSRALFRAILEGGESWIKTGTVVAAPRNRITAVAA